VTPGCYTLLCLLNVAAQDIAADDVELGNLMVTSLVASIDRHSDRSAHPRHDCVLHSTAEGATPSTREGITDVSWTEFTDHGHGLAAVAERRGERIMKRE
jgi:hypothetical protein